MEQAQTDLKWVRHLAEQGAHYLVCFLAQQASEKALKAVLYARGDELVIGHSVRQLSQRAAGPGTDDSAGAADEALDARFGTRVEKWAVLDSYYIPTRYPNGLPDDIPARVYNREAATSALALAEDVLSQVEGWFVDTAPPPSDAATG